MSPLVKLRPYQREVFSSPLGILFFVWRRQCGKSFALGCIGLDWMLSQPGVTVVFMSAALRLGMENIRKEAEVWRSVMSMMRAAADANGQFRISAPGAENDAGDLLDLDALADLFEHQKLEARLWHDNVTYSRSIVIAPNPDTAVGFTGHLVLDEVGRMPNFKEVMEAAQPFVESNPNFLIRGATTPPPDDSHWSYELLAPAEDVFPVSPVGNLYRSQSGVMVHRLDAHDAAAAGVPLYDPESRQPITPAESRAKALDKSAWDRNYGCQFIRGGTAALSRSDIAHAQAKGRALGCQAVNITEAMAA